MSRRYAAAFYLDDPPGNSIPRTNIHEAGARTYSQIRVVFVAFSAYAELFDVVSAHEKSGDIKGSDWCDSL